MPVTIQLRLPEQEPQISLSDQQQLALGADSGVQLLLGAAGSGRSATALMAAQLAVAKVGLADAWVISASRTGASQFREKLISINPATTPRVFTISALAYAMLRTQAIHARNNFFVSRHFLSQFRSSFQKLIRNPDSG